MNVLIIGSGGREHALAWKISQSKLLKKLFCSPGNPGTTMVAENVTLKMDDISGLINFAKKEKIDLTIVGPEYPLSLGIVDSFEKEGLRIFGPGRKAAAIEASKSFAKDIMNTAGVKTARCEVVEDLDAALAYLDKNGAPLVLKADGLAAGKGVFVCQSAEEARSALDTLFNKMKVNKLVIEEFLSGKEASYIVATDGHRIIPFAASNDYKRIFDNDQGPNTGGMGTVSPTPNLPEELEQSVVEKIIKPVLNEMSKRGIPFKGFLYAGLMIGADKEVNVIEFNARLGDPETQVILMRLETDLLPLLYSLSGNDSAELPEIRWKKDTAVCVVQAAAGYPGDVRNGDIISGIESAEELGNVLVFHAGTSRDKNNNLITAGGRVLNITALGANKEKARDKAYKAAALVTFEGKQQRSDIASN
jgi:phosphoribosylamine--glycine ligase